jgi:uracil-DNA glycosylase
VLLLNNTLTVRAHQAGSHRGQGWEEFTRRVIELINRECTGVVFLLWGRDARAKSSLIDATRHLILEAAHPSPFSAHSGFFGCRHFSQANTYLALQGKDPIIW